MGRRVNDLEVGAGISSSKKERGVALQPEGQLGAWLLSLAALGKGARSAELLHDVFAAISMGLVAAVPGAHCSERGTVLMLLGRQRALF